ncbi:MAG: LamG-like jellyroll fold domain-containing protein, partial [Roseibacillus sp.]
GLPMEIGGNPELFDMNWNGLVDDVAVWNRALTTGELRQIWNAGLGVPIADLIVGTDGDNDGMSDAYESAHGLNPALDDAALDLDGDGLSNKDEHDGGSHPNNVDTDGDGLEDDDEAAAGTNPLGPDSDGDGLTDGEEVNTYNTDPTKKDTDSDGFTDSAELRLGSDPNDAGSVPGFSPYVAAVLADAPSVYWQFDESSGNTASDSAGTGADGTILGGVTLAAESFHPNLGTAFHFDGASGRIDIPALGVYPTSSIEVWINIEGLAGGCCTSIYSTDTWASGNLHLNLKGGGDVEHAVNGGGPNNNNTAAGLIQNGTWYHMVVTYDTTLGGETKFYIDGALVATGAHSTANAMNLIAGEIGAWAGSRFYSGRMDEFAFYDHILTSEQVHRHYEAATAATAPEARSVNWALASEGADLVITWESEAGMRYNLRSETDLLGDPATWTLFGGHENIEATPPENTLRILRPGEEKRFFVIEEFPAP